MGNTSYSFSKTKDWFMYFRDNNPSNKKYIKLNRIIKVEIKNVYEVYISLDNGSVELLSFSGEPALAKDCLEELINN
jgi:hypothetical protein